MLNEFGKFVRQYRIEHGMLLFHMSKDLGVSPATLSGFEVGRYPVPDSWKKRLPEVYPDMDATELAACMDKANEPFTYVVKTNEP